jgi:hypothetical protein
MHENNLAGSNMASNAPQTRMWQQCQPNSERDAIFQAASISWFGDSNKKFFTSPAPTAHSWGLRMDDDAADTFIKFEIFNAQDSNAPSSAQYQLCSVTAAEYGVKELASGMSDLFSPPKVAGWFQSAISAQFTVANMQTLRNYVINNGLLGSWADLCDSCDYNNTGTPTSSSFSGWYNIHENMLEDINANVPQLIYSATYSTANSIPDKEWVLSECLLLNGNNATPICNTDGFGLEIYIEDYAPIGIPVSTLPATLGPQPTCPSSCNLALSGGLWNSADQMYERNYSNGIAFYCPTSGTPTVTCGTHTFTGTVYRVVSQGAGNVALQGTVAAGLITSPGITSAVCTPITTLPALANDTGATVLYSRGTFC